LASVPFGFVLVRVRVLPHFYITVDAPPRPPDNYVNDSPISRNLLGYGRGLFPGSRDTLRCRHSALQMAS